MIFGIGTDIVHVTRIHDSLAKYGDKFAKRILTPEEFDEFREFKIIAHKAAFVAKRFAAKEATAKAMGTGFRNGLSLQHIGVTHNENGKPTLDFIALAKTFADENNIQRTHVSLSDERDYAIAFVILEI